MTKTLKNIKQVQQFLHDIQPRTSLDVKNKFAEACSNFQVPTTGLENHFQLIQLNSYINQNMTCKENSKQFENDRQKRNPHTIEGALRLLLLQGDYYMLTRVHVSKYQNSWGSKGENANPHDDTTWSNKSKGKNADLYTDIINLSHNVSEEIAEKDQILSKLPQRKLKYFIVQSREVFQICSYLSPNYENEFFSKSCLIPICYTDKVNIEITK